MGGFYSQHLLNFDELKQKTKINDKPITYEGSFSSYRGANLSFIDGIKLNIDVKLEMCVGIILTDAIISLSRLRVKSLIPTHRNNSDMR